MDRGQEGRSARTAQHTCPALSTNLTWLTFTELSIHREQQAMLLKCTENFSRRDATLAHKFEKSHCSYSVPVKNSQFKSNHGKTSRKPKFKEFYKRTGLCSSMIMVALRNVSIHVKQTQKAWKLNAIHNPGLDPLSEIKKNCYKGNYWGNQQNWKTNCRLWYYIKVNFPEFSKCAKHM